jgi:hypothetical protein
MPQANRSVIQTSNSSSTAAVAVRVEVKARFTLAFSAYQSIPSSYT